MNTFIRGSLEFYRDRASAFAMIESIKRANSRGHLSALAAGATNPTVLEILHATGRRDLLIDWTISMRGSVDELADEAARRCGQSDVVAARIFSDGVDALISGLDETQQAIVIDYARTAGMYMSPAEIEKMDQELSDDGHCSHGLDYMTCPCGCFEGDWSPNDDDDFPDEEA